MDVFLLSTLALSLRWSARYSVERSGDLSTWEAAYWWFFAAAVVYALRGAGVPGMYSVSVVIGNTGLSMGFLLVLRGFLRCYWRDVAPAVWPVLPVLFLGTYAGLTFVYLHHDLRVLLTSLVGLVSAILMLPIIWRAGRGRGLLGYRACLAAAVLQLVGMLVRIYSLFPLEQHPDTSIAFVEDGPLFSFYLLAQTIAMVLMAIGLLMLAQHRLVRRLENLVTHDALTGTLSRRAILEAYDLRLAECRRFGRPFTLLMVDLDHFKRINDVYGHRSGDKVLRAVAQNMQANLRAEASVGRYGGEEFLVVLPLAQRGEGWQVAERVRQGVEALQVGIDGKTERVTVSLGVLELGREELKRCHDPLAAVDEALYAAKRAGRNCCRAPGDDQARRTERPGDRHDPAPSGGVG